MQKKTHICHSDKQTRFSYSWILLSLISFATIFLLKEINPIHSNWQSHFLLWRKKSVLFLSKALSWSFSILKTLILIGFLLFIPALGGYVFCSPFFNRLSSFSGCLKTSEKKIFFSLSSQLLQRDFTSYPKLLFCILKSRPLHLASQLCPQSSCSCLRLCLLC